MELELKVTTCGEYFSQTERKIDWEENDNTKISTDQADEIQKILSTEASIYLLRRASEVDGSLIDSMVNIRTGLIKNYEKEYEPYTEYNDFS